MATHQFRLWTITQTLENDTLRAEALFFPELLRFGTDIDRLQEALKTYAGMILERLPLVAIHQRRTPGPISVSEVKLEFAAPARSVIWRAPVTLKFPVLRWLHGEDAEIAYLPTLGIEVVTRDREALDDLILSHLRAELMRRKAATSLEQLVWLQRCQAIQFDELEISANIRSPRQIAANLEQTEKDQPSVLSKVGTDLNSEKLPPAYELDPVVQKIADALSARNAKNVLLIGPSGVGKSAAVYQMIRNRAALKLGRVPFWATTGSRLVAGMSGYGMWQKRCQEIWREAAKLKAILYFGNLVELMEVGKSISNSQGIASFFRPYLMRGDLQAIAECTPEQLPLIEKEDPHLLNAFYQIKVAEPDQQQGRSILLSYALAQSSQHSQGESVIELEGLEMLDLLHRRYATYSAYPGRPIRFLKNLIEDRLTNSPLTPTEITRAFSRETGLPLFMLDDQVPLDLSETRQWFCQRVIGQPAAIDLIIDLLAMVKAGLTRPSKPLASLLFIGPTGVGKTEMAKSLAQFLFQDSNRMIRFDMSEYADPFAVRRLIGGVFGSEGLLTAKVREQPFSVLLLDEVEKAHPLFFDLLLQMLGEGRLTDAGGRLADFRNAVIIMTSNLGAESFQRSSLGFLTAAAAREIASKHFVNEVRAFVRPELFNRIDRIVPFAPLDQETILQIANRELQQLRQRDGLCYRDIALQIEPAVAEYLAIKGYHPRYGARPLKRVIERELLVPLAEGMNQYGANLALNVTVIATDKLKVEVTERTDRAGKPATSIDDSLVKLANESAMLRRDTQLLESSPAFLEMNNEIYRIEKLAERIAKRSYKRPEDLERIGRLPKLKQIAKMINALAEQVYRLEDNTLLSFYGKREFDRLNLQNEYDYGLRQWQVAVLSLYALKFKRPDYVTIAVYSEDINRLFELAQAYYFAVVTAGGIAVVNYFKLNRETKEQKEVKPDDQPESKKIMEQMMALLSRQEVDNPGEFFQQPREGVIGIVMGVEQQFAFPRYEPERGLHLFIDKEQQQKCLVHTSEVAIDKYLPPPGINRRGAIGNQDRRRSYNYDEYQVDDPILKKRYLLSHHRIIETLAKAIEERLTTAARAMIEK